MGRSVVASRQRILTDGLLNRRSSLPRMAMSSLLLFLVESPMFAAGRRRYLLLQSQLSGAVPMLIGILSFLAGAAIGGYVGYAIGVNKTHKLVNQVAAAGDWHRQSGRPSD